MKRKLLIDLDGTILDSHEPINQSQEFIHRLVDREIEFLVMTNSVKSPMKIKRRLSDAGIEIPLPSILNPIIAINSYISRNRIERAFIVGSEEERTQVAAIHDDIGPEIILFLDFEKENYSFSELQRVYFLLQRGIPAISASGSPFYKSGKLQILDTGAFVKLFESALNSKIEIFGKPSNYYFNESIRILDCHAKEVIVIGDDWETDAKGALEAGCDAFLVKTGKYKDGDEKNLSGIKLIDSLMEVIDYF